jgi:ABC-2 type transport system permease protein
MSPAVSGFQRRSGLYRALVPRLKPYLGIFRMRFIAGMQYRAAAWAGVATQFFWGGMELLIYAAFYRSSGTDPGAAAAFPFGQLADLIWLRQAFLALVMLWTQDAELLNMVVKGDAAYELCRPVTTYSFWFARLLALRFSRTLLRCFPILVVASFLPEPFRFHLPPGLFQGLIFLAALLLASLLVVAISMYIYLVTFITLDSVGGRLLIGVGGEFLMGALIPIPFMPLPLRRVLEFLPLRYTADFPFRVYSGNILPPEALSGLGMQCLWLSILVAGGILGFRIVQKRILIQGG